MNKGKKCESTQLPCASIVCMKKGDYISKAYLFICQMLEQRQNARVRLRESIFEKEVSKIETISLHRVASRKKPTTNNNMKVEIYL